MRIAVMGTGGVGGYFGTRLALGGLSLRPSVRPIASPLARIPHGRACRAFTVYRSAITAVARLRRSDASGPLRFSPIWY
jgi:hypothetical protein